jgi:hypothetical protein
MSFGDPIAPAVTMTSQSAFAVWHLARDAPVGDAARPVPLKNQAITG